MTTTRDTAVHVLAQLLHDEARDVLAGTEPCEACISEASSWIAELEAAGLSVTDDQDRIDKTEFVIKLATLKVMAPSDEYRSAIDDVLRNFGLLEPSGDTRTEPADG